MTQNESEKPKEKSCKPFDDLEKSSRTVRTLTIILMMITWGAAAVRFFYPSYLALSSGSLFLFGCIFGVIGEAASTTMAALAEHMRDTRTTRNCMERLMTRIEKPRKEN